MLFYTWECFSALRCKNPYKLAGIFQRQNAVIFLTYLLGIFTIYSHYAGLKASDPSDNTDIVIIVLGGAQLCYLIVVLGIFPIIYPNINKAILSNMCMLLTVGFIILARLRFQNSIKQFIIVAIVSLASLIVPYLMSKYEMWKSLTWIYCFVGIALLLSVLVFGKKDNGANLAIKFGNSFSFQPSEFVKIIFVFFIAGMLAKSTKFGHNGRNPRNYISCIKGFRKCLNILYDICIHGICGNKKYQLYFCGLYRSFRCISGGI